MERRIEKFEIFPWDEQFATGLIKVDEQHKKLVEILNRLATNQANLANEKDLSQIFDELVDYTDYHFKTEEGVWEQYFENDSWYLEHEKTHSGFIENILSIKNDPNKTFDEAIYELVLFLAEWLAFHILDTDKRMAQAVLEMQSGYSLEEAKQRSNEYMNGSVQTLIQTVLKMYRNISVRTLDMMREKALRLRAEEALIQSEEKWRFVLESSGENIWDFDLEKAKMKHTNPDDVLAESLQQFEFFEQIHPDDVKQVKEDFIAHLLGKTEFYHNKHRVLRKDGGWTWILSRGKVLERSDEGVAKRIVGIHSDITEQELSAVIYKNSSQAMFISDGNNKIISINPAFTQITGLSKEAVLGGEPNVLFGEDLEESYRKFLSELSRDGSWSGEVLNKHKNGHKYTQELSVNVVKNADGKIDHYIGFFSDISKRKEAEHTILKQANFDPLTDLENRRMFVRSLSEAIEHSKRTQLSFAVLFIDLDHFKDINDTLGHSVGDAILIDVSNRIKNEIRKTDTLSRFGGDEFTLLLPEIKDTAAVDRIAHNIIESVKKPFKFNKTTLYISASIGITIYPEDGEDSTTLLKNADQAMYQAKHSGRSRCHYFTEHMQEAAQKRQEMLADLHTAIDEEQFEVYYQPIVDGKSGKVIKAEALVRWNHPQKGLIYPSDFISLAEETGMIIEIGDWVYKQAVMQTHKWHQKYDIDFKISVNKSPAQFGSPDTLDEWLEYKKAEGIDSRNVIVEITEGLLMKQDERIAKQLLQLRDAGIEVAIDDFGTGYSSLSYLKKFDIDYLKIDKSFVDHIVTSHQGRVLCEAMISMAHKLDMRVIAEGVEDEHQLQVLREMECDFIQGYLYSKPIPADEFEELFFV